MLSSDAKAPSAGFPEEDSPSASGESSQVPFFFGAGGLGFEDLVESGWSACLLGRWRRGLRFFRLWSSAFPWVSPEEIADNLAGFTVGIGAAEVAGVITRF